jgi:transcriptional regulator with PAS, ATPase and Fis domain
VNCAAIPDTLIESELFGYEKGAFTGAASRRCGQVELANGGTLFLDEIGDMSAPVQAKLLRAIERREVQPLGGRAPVPVDLRTLAATHQDLERLVDDGTFRSDLYFRLNVANLRLPPLRERPEDIPALAHHFLREINREHRRVIEGFTPPAIRRLTDYPWPGNVRQLRNAIESAALMCEGRRISEADLRALHSFIASVAVPLKMTTLAYEIPLRKTDSDRLVHALAATNWNITRTAEVMSCSRMTVYRKLAKYRLQRNVPTPDGEVPSKYLTAGAPG